MMQLVKTFFICSLLTVLTGCAEQSSEEQQVVDTGDWLHHGGDHSSAKYADLDQIDASNFEQLRLAWRWESADNRIPEELLYPTGDYRATPLVVNGVMYTATNHSQVVALDPASGEELWVFDPESYKLGPPNFSPIQTRGIEYWTDGEVERIFIATLGKQLVSIDIHTGQPDPD
ncbi:MAG: PQQ-binding-like beta-propeller repeat protein, partial [Gammaproteobacteria bacterium]|nr:PQQ-binding-like beta-propeller repeat protein [Gammaproteobacteria bacterium]